jgi:phosphatidylglycerophosphate synthase
MAKIIESLGQRRPIKTRQAPWSSWLAGNLVKLGISPNQVSLASVGFALLGAVFYSLATIYPTTKSFYYVGAACCIQLRLLCNMLDGLMAVEYGQKTSTGELYNELPDRLADSIFFVAAGYGCQGPLGAALGYTCALLALSTAYIRALGARFASSQDFCGPMAKPHRMFALTVGSMACALQNPFALDLPIMAATLLIIGLGSIFTCIRRTKNVAAAMEAPNA